MEKTISIHSSEIRIRTSRPEKIISLLLAIWPLLNIYGFAGDTIGIGDIIVLPTALFLFVTRISRFGKLNYNYFSFFILTVITSLIGVLFGQVGFISQTVLSIIKDFFYIFSFSVVIPKFLNMDFFIGVYKKIVTILCFLLLFQVCIYTLTKNPVPLVFNNPIIYLKDVDGYSNYISSWYHNIGYYGFKPSAIFSEPAKFVQYVSPCLILSLFEEKRKNYIFEIFLTVCMVLTTSANGVVYVAIAWLMWFLLDKSKRNIIFKGIFLLVLSGAVLFLIFGDTSNIWFIERFSEIGADGINSGNQRILRGWIIFGQIPFANKLFGVGVDNAAYYIESAGITTDFDGGYIGYMSGLSQIFVTGGILGGMLLLFLLFKYFRTKDSKVISLTILLIAIIFASSIINDPTFGIIIAVIESYFVQKGRYIVK